MSYIGANSTKKANNEDNSKPLTKEELSNMKNLYGYKRFVDYEMDNLIELSLKYPNAVRELLAITINKDGQNVERFSYDDIDDLAPMYDKYKNEIQALAKMQDEEENSLFDADNIVMLAPVYNEKTDDIIQTLRTVKDKYGEQMFDGSAISTILPLYDTHKNELNSLISMERDDGTRMFSGDDVASLLIISKNNLDTIKELGNTPINDSYNFSAFDIMCLYGGVNNVSEHLDTIKDIIKTLGDKYSIGNGIDIASLVGPYEKDPDTVNAFLSDLSAKGVPIPGTLVSVLTDDYKDHKDAILEIASKGVFYSPKEIKDVIETYENHRDLFDKFSSIQHPTLGIKKYGGEDIKNLASLYLDPEYKQFIDDNIDKIKYVKSKSSNKYIEIDMEDKKIYLERVGENKFKKVGQEKIVAEDNITQSYLENPDGLSKNGEYSKEGSDEFQGYYESETDKYGNEIVTLTVPDGKNSGVLAVMREVRDKDGNVLEYKKIASVKNYGKNGEKRMITREFESPSKVKSTQLIEETPEGRYSLYEIGDKTFERDFKVIDKNTTETNVWGNKYEAKFNEDNIEITVTKEDGTVKTATLDNEQIDFNLLPLMKQLPGDFLYKLSQTKTNIMRVEDMADYEKNAFYNNTTNELGITDTWKDDPFAFAHEFGHMLDHTVLNNLNADSELKEILKKELDAYKAQASGINEECIDYFVAKDHINKDGCLTEVIAETNAILSGLQHKDNTILLRAKILQENFPETMKYIGTKIEEAM